MTSAPLNPSPVTGPDVTQTAFFDTIERYGDAVNVALARRDVESNNWAHLETFPASAFEESAIAARYGDASWRAELKWAKNFVEGDTKRTRGQRAPGAYYFATSRPAAGAAPPPPPPPAVQAAPVMFEAAPDVGARLDRLEKLVERSLERPYSPPAPAADLSTAIQLAQLLKPADPLDAIAKLAPLLKPERPQPIGEVIEAVRSVQELAGDPAPAAPRSRSPWAEALGALGAAIAPAIPQILTALTRANGPAVPPARALPGAAPLPAARHSSATVAASERVTGAPAPADVTPAAERERGSMPQGGPALNAGQLEAGEAPAIGPAPQPAPQSSASAGGLGDMPAEVQRYAMLGGVLTGAKVAIDRADDDEEREAAAETYLDTLCDIAEANNVAPAVLASDLGAIEAAGVELSPLAAFILSRWRSLEGDDALLADAWATRGPDVDDDEIPDVVTGGPAPKPAEGPAAPPAPVTPTAAPSPAPVAPKRGRKASA